MFVNLHDNRWRTPSPFPAATPMRQSFKLKKFNLNKSHVRICAQITLKKIQFRAGWQSALAAGEQVPHNSHPSAPSFVMLMRPFDGTRVN
jgi:hypothetical protein